MLKFIIFTIFILTTTARQITGVFTSLDSLLWRNDGNYPYASPELPNWTATLSWRILGTRMFLGDKFTLTLPCVFKFASRQKSIYLKSGLFINYARCDFLTGDVVLGFSKLECVILITIPVFTDVRGTISFPVTFNVGGSGLSTDLQDSTCFTDGTNTVSFFDGPNKLSTLATFTGGLTTDPEIIVYKSRVIPSLNKLQQYLLGGSCPSGYKSGTIGITVQTQRTTIDCKSIHKAITNMWNDWYSPKNANTKFTNTFTCTPTSFVVNYQNIPAGYRPFIDALLNVPVGIRPKISYINNYICNNDIRSTNNGKVVTWPPYYNSDVGANCDDVDVTTRTYTGSITQVSTMAMVPFIDKTMTIVVDVPVPTATYTKSYIGISTSFTTYPALPGCTASIIEYNPVHTTTTITSCWLIQRTLTKIFSTSNWATDTKLIVTPCPVPSCSESLLSSASSSSGQVSSLTGLTSSSVPSSSSELSLSSKKSSSSERLSSSESLNSSENTSSSEKLSSIESPSSNESYLSSEFSSTSEILSSNELLSSSESLLSGGSSPSSKQSLSSESSVSSGPEISPELSISSWTSSSSTQLSAIESSLSSSSTESGVISIYHSSLNSQLTSSLSASSVDLSYISPRVLSSDVSSFSQSSSSKKLSSASEVLSSSEMTNSETFSVSETISSVLSSKNEFSSSVDTSDTYPSKDTSSTMSESSSWSSRSTLDSSSNLSQPFYSNSSYPVISSTSKYESSFSGISQRSGLNSPSDSSTILLSSQEEVWSTKSISQSSSSNAKPESIKSGGSDSKELTSFSSDSYTSTQESFYTSVSSSPITSGGPRSIYSNSSPSINSNESQASSGLTNSNVQSTSFKELEISNSSQQPSSPFRSVNSASKFQPWSSTNNPHGIVSFSRQSDSSSSTDLAATNTQSRSKELALSSMNSPALNTIESSTHDSLERSLINSQLSNSLVKVEATEITTSSSNIGERNSSEIEHPIQFSTWSQGDIQREDTWSRESSPPGSSNMFANELSKETLVNQSQVTLDENNSKLTNVRSSSDNFNGNDGYETIHENKSAIKAQLNSTIAIIPDTTKISNTIGMPNNVPSATIKPTFTFQTETKISQDPKPNNGATWRVSIISLFFFIFLL